MNAIDKTLAQLKKGRRVGLMTHVVVGYPSLKATVELVKTMVEAGADMVELQIPFSDPIADGPTIMKACEKALEKGVRVQDSFRVAEKISQKVVAPLLFMAYYNTVFKYGVEKFCRDANHAGVSGLIVPDLPVEEDVREHLSKYAKQNNLYIIRVLAPASTESRLAKNVEVAEGFVYCSARQGITGTRSELPPKLAIYLKKVRKFTDLPIAVGFGISKPGHVKVIFRYADIVVVGSAAIDVVNRSTSKTLIPDVRRFIMSLKKGTRSEI